MPVRNKAVIPIFMAFLVGCTTNAPAPQVSVIHESQPPRLGDPKSKTDASDSRKYQNTAEDAFVRSIADTRPNVPVDAVIGLSQVRGYYLGKRDGCDRVSLLNSARRVAHYKVCGDSVREIPEVAPSMPRSSDLAQLRDSIARRAWETKTQALSTFEGYALSAIPVGISDSQGCMMIEEYVAYDGMLVNRQQRRFCP